MRRAIFSYGVRFRENGQIETFPAMEVFIFGRRAVGIRALFHIDSGATTSILPESDGYVLGINVRSGKKMLVRGISGESFVGYRHSIYLQLNQMKIKIPVIFVENVLVPRILGREGVFLRFGVLFDEFKYRIAFLDAQEERKMLDSLFEIEK